MKLFFNKRGSIFVITLNIIILLSIALLSFNFTSLIKYQAAISEAHQYQAHLNSQSGLNITLNEIRNNRNEAVPYKKTIILFHDENHSAEISVNFAEYINNRDDIKIQKSADGPFLEIQSIGKYKGYKHRIITLLKNNSIVFQNTLDRIRTETADNL